MDKIELIKAEIERRIAGNSDAKARVLSEILTFINSLPEDEPSEDLEKAAIQAAQIDMCDRQIMEDSHEHRMLYSRIFRRGFKAGAQWQNEQMMKEAVEGKILGYMDVIDCPVNSLATFNKCKNNNRKRERKMKANELMVGNLVRVNRDGLCIKKDTIVEVRGVDADDRLVEKGLVGVAHCNPLDKDQFEGGIWCKYLDPIPLTPEILEKNGFVEDNAFAECLGYEIFGMDSLLCGISCGEEIDTWTFETFKFWTDVDIDGAPIDWGYHFKANIPNIRYVHELQHALRLCGIDKEIIL